MSSSPVTNGLMIDPNSLNVSSSLDASLTPSSRNLSQKVATVSTASMPVTIPLLYSSPSLEKSTSTHYGTITHEDMGLPLPPPDSKVANLVGCVHNFISYGIRNVPENLTNEKPKILRLFTILKNCRKEHLALVDRAKKTGQPIPFNVVGFFNLDKALGSILGDHGREALTNNLYSEITEFAFPIDTVDSSSQPDDSAAAAATSPSSLQQAGLFPYSVVSPKDIGAPSTYSGVSSRDIDPASNYMSLPTHEISRPAFSAEQQKQLNNCIQEYISTGVVNVPSVLRNEKSKILLLFSIMKGCRKQHMTAMARTAFGAPIPLNDIGYAQINRAIVRILGDQAKTSFGKGLSAQVIGFTFPQMQQTLAH